MAYAILFFLIVGGLVFSFVSAALSREAFRMVKRLYQDFYKEGLENED